LKSYIGELNLLSIRRVLSGNPNFSRVKRVGFVRRAQICSLKLANYAILIISCKDKLGSGCEPKLIIIIAEEEEEEEAGEKKVENVHLS
jgi:hypothetical protein